MIRDIENDEAAKSLHRRLKQLNETRKKQGRNDDVLTSLKTALAHDGFSDEGEAWDKLVEYYQTHQRVVERWVAMPDLPKCPYP